MSCFACSALPAPPPCTTIRGLPAVLVTRHMDTTFVIGPNASLTPGQAAVFMSLTSVVGLTIAFGFALIGFWPVIPFAGLELAALGAALWVSLRRNRYREVVRLQGDEVVVEFGMVGVGVRARMSLPRHWTRVLLIQGASRLAPNRLVLAYAAQRVELARCLTDDEREALAGRLRRALTVSRPTLAGAAHAPDAG